VNTLATLLGAKHVKRATENALCAVIAMRAKRFLSTLHARMYYGAKQWNSAQWERIVRQLVDEADNSESAEYDISTDLIDDALSELDHLSWSENLLD